MEPNLPIIAKKFWHMVRVALFMLRKGISKSKLLADLNMMLKRGKIAGKAIQNLMFHHSHHWASSVASVASRRSHDRRHLSYTMPHLHDYEFSCSNSPAYPSFHLPFNSKRKNYNHHHVMFSPAAASTAEDDQFITANALMKALEMLQSETASPVNLPGFGRSPMVRQLRITDSPFPLRGGDDEEDSSHVDEAAEEFIMKFYKDLRKQNTIAAF